MIEQPETTPGYTDASGVYRNAFGRPGRHLHSEIMVKNGMLKNLGAYDVLPEKCRGAKNYLVSDDITAKHYAEDVLSSLRGAGVRVELLVVPSVTDESQETSTEPSKTVGHFMRICDSILAQGITKHSCIISLGGGVVNNMCGMLASCLYRGIALVHITTTTMGAFDAAIDFKQAINHELGKNLLGSYYPASTIVIDPTTFATLSPRHLLNGVAEALKHGLTQSRHLTDLIVRPVAHNKASLVDPSYLEAVCRACIESKVPTLTHYESSNFNEMCPQYGHAIGHAVEHLSWHPFDESASPKPSPLLHGEAVAIGMCVSAEVALLMGLCTEDVVDEHYECCLATGLPAHVPAEIPLDDVIRKMAYDKHHVKVPTMGLVHAIGVMAKNPNGDFAWEVQGDVVEEALKRNVAKRRAVTDSPEDVEMSIKERYGVTDSPKDVRADLGCGEEVRGACAVCQRPNLFQQGTNFQDDATRYECTCCL